MVPFSCNLDSSDSDLLNVGRSPKPAIFVGVDRWSSSSCGGGPVNMRRFKAAADRSPSRRSGFKLVSGVEETEADAFLCAPNRSDLGNELEGVESVSLPADPS